MGKRGSWFSAIRKVFAHNSKEKPSNVSNKKGSNEKKKGIGISRHGEGKSFIPPLFREPSSIEKILGEADELFIRPPRASTDEPKTTSTLPWRSASPRAASIRHTSTVASSKMDFSEVSRNRKEISYVRRPEPTFRHRHLSATRIQSAYRGYQARQNFRSLRGLVRLQGMVRSQNAKRQTINAMKQMQLLVRVQTQIKSRRIQMLENQTLYQQGSRDEKEDESVLSKWTKNHLPEAELNEDWDASLLTKEEIEARSWKKVEAAMKRERAMAYAYSHQLWNSTNPKSPHTPLEDQPNAFPWLSNWLQRQPPPTNSPQTQSTTKIPVSTPPRPIPYSKPGPQHNPTNNHSKNKSFTLTSNQGTKHFQTTPIRTPSPANITSNSFKYSSKQRATNHSPYNEFPLRDDDSLTSCPPFSVPNYMTPTKSAKAKARANSNPKERLQGSIATPVNDSKRRFSFSFTPNIGSFKWSNNKGPSKKSSSPQKVVFEKNQYPSSIGDLSVDSANSMPAMVGRKPFNRFV